MNGRGWMIGLLAVMLAGLSDCGATEAAERVALVVGNSEYAHAPSLSNPKRDAEAIARTLSGLGFAVTGPLLNQSKAQMDAALKAFRRRAQGATAAVVYFAGHGVEIGGRNYLLPTDAVLDRESDASLRAVALNVVLDQMSGASNYRLVILDACRDNPMANNMRRSDGTRSASRGLAPIDPSGQTYVAYAARAGQRSQDGAAGGNSPYAAALLKYLPQSGLPLERLFGAVREEVLRTTTRTQEPALYGAFGSEPIYLAGPGATAPIASAPAPMVAAPPPTPAVDHDYEAWKSAEKCGTAACFEAYLEDYPKGRYAKMARARLKPVESAPPPRPVVETLIGDRYRDHGDGTVTDVKTGLQWMRCALGQTWQSGTCTGEAKSYAWQGALDAATRGYAGHGDWRVPTKDELKTLIYCSSGQPKTWNDTEEICKSNYERLASYESVFPKIPYKATGKRGFFYWSSSTDNPDSAAWGVDFLDGFLLTYEKVTNYPVLLVRGRR